MFTLMIAIALLHPFHTTSAEMEWNAESGKWEVSLKMQSFDVQRALQSQSETPVSLDRLTDEDWKREMSKYLAPRFKLENAAKQPSKLEWVGFEERGASLWFYFELTPPKDIQGLRLIQSVLHEFETDQVNTVTFRGKVPRSVMLTRKRPAEPISLSAMPASEP